MATLPLRNNFNGGTATSQVTVANSGGDSGTAFDAQVGTLGLYQTAAANHGLLGMQIVQSGAAASAAVEWTGLGSLTTASYLRFYFNLGEVASIHRLVVVRTATPGAAMIILLSAAAHIAVLDAASATVAALTGAATLLANTWYRLEVLHTQNGASSSCTHSLYVGDTETLTETKGPVTFTGGANYDRVGWGPVSGATASTTTRIDDVAADALGPIGPAVVPPDVTRSRVAYI